METNLISNANNLNKHLKKNCFNIVTGGDYELNKIILNNKYVNLLIDSEPLEKDFVHYRNSGLNQVLIKLAKKNNISIGFSLNRINNLNKLQKINLFGKIMQNIMLCNKYKVKLFIVNFINKNEHKNINDLIALGLSLGAKKINILQEKI